MKFPHLAKNVSGLRRKLERAKQSEKDAMELLKSSLSEVREARSGLKSAWDLIDETLGEDVEFDSDEACDALLDEEIVSVLLDDAHQSMSLACEELLRARERESSISTLLENAFARFDRELTELVIRTKKQVDVAKDCKCQGFSGQVRIVDSLSDQVKRKLIARARKMELQVMD